MEELDSFDKKMVMRLPNTQGDSDDSDEDQSPHPILKMKANESPIPPARKPIGPPSS